MILIIPSPFGDQEPDTTSSEKSQVGPVDRVSPVAESKTESSQSPVPRPRYSIFKNNAKMDRHKLVSEIDDLICSDCKGIGCKECRGIGTKFTGVWSPANVRLVRRRSEKERSRRDNAREDLKMIKCHLSEKVTNNTKVMAIFEE